MSVQDIEQSRPRLAGNLWYVARSALACNKIASLRAGHEGGVGVSLCGSFGARPPRFLHNSARSRNYPACVHPYVCVCVHTCVRMCICVYSSEFGCPVPSLVRVSVCIRGVYLPLKYRHECPACGRVSGSHSSI